MNKHVVCGLLLHVLLCLNSDSPNLLKIAAMAVLTIPRDDKSS